IIRDNVMEALSGVKGENSIKLFGPDLLTLEETADKIKKTISAVPGVVNAGVVHITGQSNLEFAVDRQKCARWNVAPDDVMTGREAAAGGKAMTQMTEGEKTFDITLRWPLRLRGDEQSILQIPVEVAANQVRSPQAWGQLATAVTGSSAGLSPTGTLLALP